MAHRTLRVSCVALLLIFAGLPLSARTADGTVASPQDSANEAALRTLIGNYFTAYASKDLDAIAHLWSTKSPDLELNKARLSAFFTLNNQVATKNLNLHPFQIDGEHATVLVTLEVTTVDAQTNNPGGRVDKGTQDFSFVREAGDWKVWRVVLAHEELAARLLAMKDEQGRQTILSAQPAMVDVGLQRSLTELGELHRSKSNYSEALAAFSLARQVAAQINDQLGLAEVANSLGSMLLSQGKRDAALESYQQGLDLCTALADQGCIAVALLGIGNGYAGKANHELAIDFIGRALAINERSANEQGIFRALISLGNTYLAQGDYGKALETYQKALPISEPAGNTQRLALVTRNIGVVYRLRGEAAAAIESLQKSAALYEKLGDRTGVAAVNTGIGIVYSQRGDYSSAMRYFQKCLDVFEKLENKKGVADSLGNIGIVLRLQGNYSLALEYQQRALALNETIGEQQGVAHSLNNLGIIYMHAGDYARALETYQKSLKLNETLGNKSEVASVFNNLGVVYREQGAYDLALETFRKSLQIREQLGEKGQISNLLRSIGIAYQLKGDPLNAATYSEQSAGLAREVGFREVLASALTTAGNAYLTLGETEKARTAFAEAIATVEALRGQVGGGEQDQQRFFEGQVSPYYRMVELLASRGNTTEALSYAERGKARLLLDVLKGGRVRIEKAMTVAEREQEQKLRDTFVLLNSQINAETRQAHPDQKRLGQLKAKVEAARLLQQEFQTRLYAAHSELQIQRGDVPQFRPEDAAALGADVSTALLEYVVTDSKTYLFVLTRAKAGAAAEVNAFTIPIKRTELAAAIEAFREKLATHNLLVREPARRAYDLLLKQAQALLRGKSNLIIVPDDVLWELPFQALQTESNRYLIEQSAISYAPSLTVLREMTARRREHHATVAGSSSLLALGNPALGQETIERAKFTRRGEKLEPLPEAEREVQTLARLYGPSQSEVFIGPEAREDRVKTEAGKFRVLHFATHGIVNNTSPMYSYLLLSQGDSKEDGLLEAWELLNLDLKADLVVLSACETARGRLGAGEGMIGLNWALFVAGTPTAVVSQWKVDSASTTELMLEFHRNLLAPNSKAQSLRKAMLKMLASNQYKHPFYWAPFVVIGDAN